MVEHRLSRVRHASSPGIATSDAPAVSDLNAQGWAIGYSLAGEVVAVGEGVTDLAAGDLVSAAGAGQAAHAEYVNVPRNLVCRIPPGCDLKQAASATIGAIALQGVRAPPQLANACVVGLAPSVTTVQPPAPLAAGRSVSTSTPRVRSASVSCRRHADTVKELVAI